MDGEREYYMGISFPRLGESKAIRVRNLIMREVGAESVTIYFDTPIEDHEDDSEEGDI